jgi:hypothetical protein
MSQLIALPCSFLSFISTAGFLYRSQKLGTYEASSLSVKTIVLLFLVLSMQSLTPIVIWAFVAAYQGLYIFVAIGAIMIIQYFILETFVFGWSDKEKVYDAVLCGEPSQNREEKVRQVFKTAIVTSWIAPFTFWCNNKPSYFEKQKRGLSVMSNYFYQISSAITTVCLLVILCVICVLNKLEMNNFSNKNAPVTHCFHHENNTGNSTFTFLVNGQRFQYSNNLIDIGFTPEDVYERVCEQNEEASDFFFYYVAPVLTAGLLLFLLVILVNVWMEKSKKKFLNHEVNGDACLKFAFQKGLYADCEQMICAGGNPFQTNFKSKSLHSLIQNLNLTSHKETNQTWLGETFFQNIEFAERTEDSRGIVGIAFISDVEGKIRWSMEMKDKDDIVLSKCMLKEASIMIERSDNIKKDQILSKELHNLKLYATTLKPSFKGHTRLICRMVREPVFKKSFWKITLLHKAIQKCNINWYDWLCKLGANPEAQNADSLTPLEMAMKKFHDDLSHEEKIDHAFIWKILVRGGTKFLKPEDIYYIVRNFPRSDSHEKLPTKHAEPLFLHTVHWYNYEVCKSYKMDLQYFLRLGCSLTTSSADKKMTVLHLAAQHQKDGCLSELLVNIY